MVLALALPAMGAKKPKPKRPKREPTMVERLGLGHRAYEAGDYEGARKELEKIDLKQIENGDYALYFLAQSELLTGKAEAAKLRFEALAKLPGRFQLAARWRAADAAWAAGKWEDARKAYETCLRGPQVQELEPAVARARIAEALDKARKTAEAQAAWRRLYVEHPAHPLAEGAPARLEALKAPPITAEERITRARTLTAQRGWTRALDELALVPEDAPPRVRDEHDYWYGMTKFKMRRDYDLAAHKLLSVWERLPGEERRVDALFHGARAKSRADLDDDAIAGYREVLKRFPHSRLAPEASFLIGWLDFNRGKFVTAIPALEETLKRYGGKWRDDARWYLGFSRWLSGDTKGALADFDKVSQLGGSLVRGKGDYWAAQALDKLGRADEANARRRAIVAQHPFSWYATLARAQLKAKGEKLSPFGDPPRTGNVPLLGDPDPALDDDPLIRRVDELINAGLVVSAGVELRRGESDFMRRIGSPRALPVLFDRYERAEAFQRPFRLSEAMSGAALRLDPHADPNVRRWWERAHPLAYRAFVEKYGPSGDNPPYYLYTIMQKESAYDPHDVSYADAIGLLQMIPPTSRKVAQHVGTPYTDDVLYDPEGNVRFGAWYIGHLLAKFKAQIPIGAGSYNAGPKAMMRWLEKNGDKPLDLFVELCAYTQTREYMKKASEIYARYVWLYEKEDWLPSLDVDKTASDDGIDY